jgi:hypothetical protein
MQNQKRTTFMRVVVLIALYCVGGLSGKKTTFLSGSVVLVWIHHQVRHEGNTL